MKRNTPDHWKMDALAAKLGICLAQAVGHMEMLFHLTAKQTPHGNIGKMPNAYIAKKCGWDGDPDVFVSALIECRWLDVCFQQRLIVHDWHEHCDEATKKSVQRSETAFFRPVSTVPDNGGQCPTTSDKICLPSLAKPSQATPTPRACEEENPPVGLTPLQRDLSETLILPPLVVEAMRAYTPEVQRSAWEVLQQFTRYSPGTRSVPVLGRMAAAFADILAARPDARHRFNSYFSVKDPEQLQREVTEGKRLSPGASPWEICDWLFGQKRAPPATKPDTSKASQERAKKLAAEADKPKPEQLARLRSVTRNHGTPATA